MKKIYFSAAVAMLLASASCQNEVVVEEVQGREFRVEVSVGGGSRTHIGQDGTMTWSEGDQIYVGSLDDKNTGGVLTLVSGAGTPNAVFSGLVKGGSDLQYSVFPVPEEDGKIDLTSRKAGQPNAPLISTFDGSGSLTFDKTCAVVRIDVSGTKGGTLTLNSEEKNLSGTAVVVYNSTTSKYELQYTRGTGGVTITDLPQDGYIDVPVITKAVNNGTDDNLQENAEVPFVIGVAGEELEFTAKVQTGQVTATGVPSIDVEEGGNIETTVTWDGESVNTNWYDADNTSFEISTASELAGLAKLVNDGNTFKGKTITLRANLDLNNHEWTPIGLGSLGSHTPFNGTFDGNNKTIKNLNINKIGSEGIALFGHLRQGGTIKNIILKDVNVLASKYVGAVVGYAYVETSIENCHVFGGIIGGEKITGDQGKSIGSVVGAAQAVLKDCSVIGTEVWGTEAVGGIVGRLLYSSWTMTGCQITGSKVYYKTQNGGEIIGQINNGLTIDPSNTAQNVIVTQIETK